MPATGGRCPILTASWFTSRPISPATRRVRQRPGQAYYLVRVALPKAEVERLEDFRLLPGMPAEVFVQTHTRTPLQYLLKPLREQIARTFRER